MELIFNGIDEVISFLKEIGYEVKKEDTKQDKQLDEAIQKLKDTEPTLIKDKDKEVPYNPFTPIIPYYPIYPPNYPPITINGNEVPTEYTKISMKK